MLPLSSNFFINIHISESQTPLTNMNVCRYYTTQHLSAKSDVFSFGVVLLEIVSGREPLNIHRPRAEWSLVEWVWSKS